MAQKNLRVSNSIPVAPAPLQDKAKVSQNSTFEQVPAVAKANLRRLYDNLSCSEMYKSVNHYIENNTKKAAFSLDFNHVQKNMQQTYSKMLKDLDRLDHFIFDLVPFTEAGESMEMPDEQDEQDRQVFTRMNDISTSFRNILQDDQRKSLNKEKKNGYKLSVEYLDQLRHFEETEYEELFKQQRDGVFLEAIQAIFNLNKKNFINGFNLRYLSLPVEHSP
mmetsp:Transcript_23582/g.36278  ORF Transcript_23582/g.36278 Transcript_23582/m.36278 type:complete len:220 (-) Transcript_23582:2080-2739(-)